MLLKPQRGAPRGLLEWGAEVEERGMEIAFQSGGESPRKFWDSDRGPARWTHSWSWRLL